MNTPIRSLSVVALALVMAVMGSSTWIQVGAADALADDPRNVRALYRDFSDPRGPIVVQGEEVVFSAPVEDFLGVQRSYTDGELYAHVTGFYSLAVNSSGIEKTHDDVLSGNADSQFWSRIFDAFAGREPEGASVELTLHAEVQRAAATALGDQAGAVVALDPRTGEILALASTPSYDPADLAVHDTGSAAAAYEALLTDAQQPLINRAISGDTYAPGSLFKLVVAAAALERGATPQSELAAPRELPLPQSTKVLRNFNGEECSPTGVMTLQEALAASCNTAFANLAMEMTWEPIERKAQEFGWGESLAIPLAVTESRLSTDPDSATTAIASIGQHDVRVTPLQVAMLISGIAYDGVVMKPHVVSAVRAPDAHLLEKTEPTVLYSPLDSSHAHALRDMMVYAVESGTGVGAQIEGVRVGGKTGTAENDSGQGPHAWFAGFAPAEDPRVVVVVFIENGGDDGRDATGGSTAAPLAASIFEAALSSHAASEGGDT